MFELTGKDFPGGFTIKNRPRALVGPVDGIIDVSGKNIAQSVIGQGHAQIAFDFALGPFHHAVILRASGRTIEGDNRKHPHNIKDPDII